MGMTGLLGSLLGAGGGRMIGSMLGGRTGGMIGSLAGSMLGGKAMRGGGGGAGGLGGMLGGLMGGGDDNQAAAPANLNDSQAEILIRAMVNSAKADGQVDEKEVNAIVGKLGNDIDAADEAFLRAELAKPLDVQGFIDSVPADLSTQVYAMSLLSIDLDHEGEKQYLMQLANGLGIDADTANAIHDDVDAPKIF